MDALYLGTLEHFSVWYSVLPSDMEQGPEASHVESIELLSMPAVDCPRLACIEKGRQNRSE